MDRKNKLLGAWAVGIIAAIFLFGWIGKTVVSDYESKIAAWKTVTDQTLADNAALKKSIVVRDSINAQRDKIITEQTHKIGLLRDSVKIVRSHRPNVDSVLANLPDTCKEAKATIENLLTEKWFT
jgi:hypothetical protein